MARRRFRGLLPEVRADGPVGVSWHDSAAGAEQALRHAHEIHPSLPLSYMRAVRPLAPAGGAPPWLDTPDPAG
jgi:hypothetical protein